ncbi:MAG: TonB-dependent receptor [Cytophagales bacterium]
MNFIYLTLFCVSLNLLAQKLFVIDSQTQKPIEWVGVKGEKNKFLYLLTDKKGEVDISALNGEVKIEIAHVSYQKKQVSFSELEASNFKIELTPEVVTIDEVVVSGTRWSQDKKELSSRVISISPDLIELQNPQTAADLLGLSGEVFVQKSQQGGGSPMIRGFSTNRLIYSVDGVRMNTAIFRGGNIQNVISLDPFAMQRVEVLLGPGSVIYGSDAIGGVMSFSTLKPLFSDSSQQTLVSGKALVRSSSANQEKTAHFDVNIGFKKIVLLTSISKNQFGDLKMGNHGPDEYLRKFYVQRIDSIDRVIENEKPLIQKPTAYDQINLMQKVAWRPSKNLELIYALHYSETSEYSRYDRLIETNPANGKPISSVWKYGPQKWMMNVLTLEFNRSNTMFDKVSTRFALQEFEESRIDRNFAGSNRNRLRTTLEQVDAFSTNIDFNKTSGKFNVMYGLEWVKNEVYSKGTAINIANNNPLSVSSRYPRANWQSTAIYVHAQTTFFEKLKMLAGVRANHFSLNADFSQNLAFYPLNFEKTNVQNTAFTGHIGSVFNPDDKTQLAFQASTAFRAPNVDDMGKIFDISATESIVPNQKLKAEYAYNLEINLNKLFSNLIKFEASLFHSWLEHALVRRPTQIDGSDSIIINNSKRKIYSIQNAANATVYGFHVGAEIKLGFGFDLNTKLNYQKGEELMENGFRSPSRHAAPAFGISSLNFKKNKLFFSVYAVYSASVSHQNLNEEEKLKVFIYAKDGNGKSYSPSWVTINFKSTIKIDRFFSVSAGVENLSDLRYRPYSSGIVAPGRNFVISLTAQF